MLACLLAACCLLAKPGRSILDTKEGYKTKTGSTSSVNTNTSKRSPPRTDHFEHTYMGFLKTKKLPPWGYGPWSQVLGAGWGRSEVRKNLHVLHTHWDSHAILRILGIHTWSKNEILPPPCFPASFTPNWDQMWSGLLNILAVLGGGGGSRAAAGRPRRCLVCAWYMPNTRHTQNTGRRKQGQKCNESLE